MKVHDAILVAVSMQELLNTLIQVPVLVALTMLTAIILIVSGLLIGARRRFRGEIGALVQAVEELRSGHGRGHSDLPHGSRLGLVSDAINRLGIELHNTWSEAATAAERWRAVTDATKDTAIITTDTDGDVRSFSSGASHLLGWEEGEMLSRPAAVLYEESSYKELLPRLARRSLRAQGVTTRSTMVRRDSSTFQAEVSVRMLLGAGQQAVGFMMLVRDITDQTRLENELRDSERRYRDLVGGLAEGVVIVKDGRIVYANTAAEALCGSTAHALLGTTWRDRVSTQSVLIMDHALETWANGTRGPESLRCALIDPDGNEGAEVLIKPGSVEFAGGPAVILLLEDQSAEWRIHSELQRNEMRLDAVLEATSDGVLVLGDDPASLVQMSNAAFGEMFGLRAEEILGASEDRLLRLLHESGAGGRGLADFISEDPEHPLPTLVGVAGPPQRELLVTMARLSGRGGGGLGRVVACRDVTKQRRSERELQDQAEKLQLSKVELEKSYRELNEVHRTLEARTGDLDGLNRELQRLDKLKSDLIGNVSHELQTPLVSIRGYTEMILKERLGPVNAEQRKGLSLSLKNIDRLISMIDNLMAFSRSDHGLRNLRPIHFGLRPLVVEVAALLDEKLATKGLKVAIEIDETGLAVHADRDSILQVFLNLLSNAVKFSYKNGRIVISARRDADGHASVSVKDGGMGIPAEAQGRIFDRHFRVDRPAEQSAEGSGIGLAIVRDILRMHGCTISVSSDEGRGTEFTFTLPLSRDEEGTDDDAIDEVRAESDHAAGGGVGLSTAEDSPSASLDEPGAQTSETPRPRLRIIRRFDSES